MEIHDTSDCSKDIPVIKAFIYEGKNYLYDTYTNRLFRVSKEQFSEIGELQRIGITKYKSLNKGTQTYEDILMLLQKGIMKSRFIEKIEHPATDYIEYILDRCINDVTLQVTQDCNFRCRYCLFANNNGIERVHKKVNMTWETAKKSIDFLYTHSKDSGILTIAFYGGEPMLNFELIKNVVDYAENLFLTKKVKFRMTFNGSILTDQMMDFIVDHDFFISISFDGPEEIQDKHRKFNNSGKGTFNVVNDNIERLKKRYKKYFENNVSFIPVVFADEDEKKVINFYNEQEIPENKIMLLDADTTGIDYHSRSLNNYQESRFKYKTDELSFMNKNTIPTKWQHNGPCIPSIKSLFVDVNGNFFPCESVVAINDLSMGNIEDGLKVEKVISFLNIGKLTEQECKSCWLMRFCSICVLNCIDIDKKTLTKEQKLISCQGQEYRALSFLKKVINEEIHNNNN